MKEENVFAAGWLDESCPFPEIVALRGGIRTLNDIDFSTWSPEVHEEMRYATTREHSRHGIAHPLCFICEETIRVASRKRRLELEEKHKSHSNYDPDCDLCEEENPDGCPCCGE